MENKYNPSNVNKVLEIQPNQLFIADVIGMGIYRMVENGINYAGRPYAIVECRKLFMKGFESIGHKTTCHPIDIDNWNTFKKL